MALETRITVEISVNVELRMNEKYCQQLFQRNPTGLCPYVNYAGSGLRAGIANDVEGEEQVAETEQALRHIKDGARQTVQSSQDRKPQF